MAVKSKKTRIGDLIVAFLCVIVILVCLLPMVNVLSRSLSSPDALVRNEVLLLPKEMNFEAYKMVLGDSKYTWSLAWTAIITVIGTCLSMFMTTICAYPLIYDNLKGKKLINAFILFTMYFNAGTIPLYLLLKDLDLLNRPAVLVVPYCLSVFNMIIMRSFFYGIPDSLRESAEIDGAGPVRILVSIYLPLSTPVIATLSLFYAVGRWNGFSDALMFMNKREYWPIQLLLYNILNNMTSLEVATQEGFTKPALSDNLKAATVMFATVPILMVYPWLQKYFITGVHLGSIKG
ncbi:binding-protein-dependent transport systems inner membrane component [Thermoclostridium stercorarium subsp. stercorarium DSM 8532]|uniref:Binding-protein-dependent transport systems inner membrane component n=2 Tax=Thermoclostridium stercorarium TaxID=1510 RepID=L7VMG0_THES1|nr:carbohydrate ABC transporter permease [Thermoclostridium stercorarium]AGC67834.1 binding-protein-dependent transport systems inner membrane component [Thermoclostridium stercorarium subsp. stercorarium DSM 8532]AGI38874.1 ABC transporter permease subunit [Thermoclostridium stercorarium subsp. stercorarium DSM 8532]ANW98244.1 ABC transporter permease [Thermoclostridium stercorarium subsp. thermolacticum DSM 2910]